MLVCHVPSAEQPLPPLPPLHTVETSSPAFVISMVGLDVGGCEGNSVGGYSLVDVGVGAGVRVEGSTEGIVATVAVASGGAGDSLTEGGVGAPELTGEGISASPATIWPHGSLRVSLARGSLKRNVIKVPPPGQFGSAGRSELVVTAPVVPVA